MCVSFDMSLLMALAAVLGVVLVMARIIWVFYREFGPLDN